MEKKVMNFVKDGAIKLPPGFRFQPTDEEIVFQYLARKITSCPFPASVIPDIDGNVCKYDPWNLPGDLEQDKYFFSKKEAKHQSGSRSNRATGSGYWKATGFDKQIVCPNRKQNVNVIMGMRKTLVFHKGKHPHWSRTNWIMHEYRLVQTNEGASTTNRNSMIQMGDWVLCHVFLKFGSTPAETIDEMIQPVFSHDSMSNINLSDDDDSSPTSSSSSSSSFCGTTSVITEVSSYGSDSQQTSGRN